MTRDILHIRLDAFFATVEQRRRPNLRGRPVIVVGSKDMLRGKKPPEAYPEAYREVVVSASREARKSGVKEEMSVRHARRACPDALLFKADYPAYRLVFEEFLEMLSHYSPLLEPDSLGSAFMDVTAGHNLFGDPSQLCARMISEVSAHLDMPLCIGCAPNKLLARIASGLGKGCVRVRPGGESDFLANLPVAMLDVVDSKFDKRLGELGVSKIGQLARVSERALMRQFGPVGSLISKQARGIDFSPVRAAYPKEVISIEHTFYQAAEEPAEIEEQLRIMADECAEILRRQNTLAGEIMLAITYEKPVHPELVEGPAYYTFKKPTDSAYTIAQALVKLLGSLMEPGMEVSKASIELSELTRGESCQLSLIGENERGNRLNRVIELIADRFGEGTIFVAASVRQRSAYVSSML
jgi:DNA polymerase-4